MKIRTPHFAAMALIGITLPARSALDVAAGEALARSVCAACHGANGISVAEHIPNLAGQRAAYLSAQLVALKEGSRKSDVMNAIAAQLDAPAVANVSSYFASLQTPTSAQKSAFLDSLRNTRVSIPENYRATFTRYRVSNNTDAKSLSSYYANDVALRAVQAGTAMPSGAMLISENAKAKLDERGNPITGADGYYVADRVISFAAMATGARWGESIPEMLRNGDWNYALLGADRTVSSGVNYAECFACHKPIGKTQHVFSYADLEVAAKRKAPKP
jgi:cytochrome c553